MGYDKDMQKLEHSPMYMAAGPNGVISRGDWATKPGGIAAGYLEGEGEGDGELPVFAGDSWPILKKTHPILFKYRNVFFLYRNVLTLFCGMINMSNETEYKERKDNTSLVTTFSNSKLINENIYMTTVTIDY